MNCQRAIKTHHQNVEARKNVEHSLNPHVKPEAPWAHPPKSIHLRRLDSILDAPVEDSTLGHLKIAFIWAALCLRKVAPIGAIIWTGTDAGKSFKPKCNKILWIKTGKKRPCPFEVLSWTSTSDRMERVRKLIGASVTRAYKNAHLLMGIIWRWEIDHTLWHKLRKNK